MCGDPETYCTLDSSRRLSVAVAGGILMYPVWMKRVNRADFVHDIIRSMNPAYTLSICPQIKRSLTHLMIVPLPL